MAGGIDSKLWGTAYHEAGHAIVAYYYGCRLGPMSISTIVGYPQGNAAAYPDSPHQAEILVAGRSCAEAFGFEQTREETAMDDWKLSNLLSEGVTEADDDGVLESLEANVRAAVANLFRRNDFRAAAEALAGYLYAVRVIDNGADVERVICQYLDSAPPA